MNNSILRSVAAVVITALIISLMGIFWRLWPVWLLIFAVTGLSYYFITYQKRNPSENPESFFTELMIWLHSDSFRKVVRKTIFYVLGAILVVVIISVGLSMLGYSAFNETETEKKCMNTVEYLNKYKSHANNFPPDLEKKRVDQRRLGKSFGLFSDGEWK
jgi:ABC-type Na+ efflux pump permease subunit